LYRSAFHLLVLGRRTLLTRTRSQRKAFLSPAFLPLGYLVSLAPPVTTFLRAKLPILPECYIVHRPPLPP